MFPERIETDRLGLTALTPERVDVLAYYRVCSGNVGDDIDAVTEYLPWEPHDTPRETEEFLDALAEQRETGENAEYVVRPQDGGPSVGEGTVGDASEIVGAVGLAPHWDRRTGELGIWLREPFWGRGYYGEAFAELAQVAFDRLDLDAVEIVHRHGNDKSRRATEKFVERFGGRHEGRFRNMWTGPGGPADAHRYTVSKAEYETAVNRAASANDAGETNANDAEKTSANDREANR